MNLQNLELLMIQHNLHFLVHHYFTLTEMLGNSYYSLRYQLLDKILVEPRLCNLFDSHALGVLILLSLIIAKYYFLHLLIFLSSIL